MAKNENLRKSLDPSQYESNKDWQPTLSDVDEAMKKTSAQLRKEYSEEELNKLCQACNLHCGGTFAGCVIGDAIHKNDHDGIDLPGSAQYNRYIHEL